MSAPHRHPPPPAGSLSELTISATSVGLAVYLVGLVLTIAGNSVSGSSALVQTIKQRLFSSWMGPAWLDLGFDHPLTYGLPDDADHALEVRRFQATGVRVKGASLTGSEAKGDTLRLPGDRTGERAARWRRLARRIASAASDETAVPLAAGVGQGAFTAVGGADVLVRVVRWPLQERGAPPQDPRPVSPYQARVRLVDGEIQLVELGGEPRRGELAPVLRDQPAGAAAAAQDTSP
ncbi:MAG: hypothetical protein ACKO1M_03200 [Planctomycetota bacterium]